MARVETMITDLTPAEVVDEYIAEASKADFTGAKKLLEVIEAADLDPNKPHDFFPPPFDIPKVLPMQWEPAKGSTAAVGTFQVEAKIFDLDTAKPLHCTKCGKFVSKYTAHYLICDKCAFVAGQHLCHVCNKPYTSTFDSPVGSTGCCCVDCLAVVTRRNMTNERKLLAKKLGLDAEFVPFIEAADFYLLLYLSLDHPEYKALVDARADRLAERLSLYMFYAVGGEIRHYPWRRCKENHCWGEQDSCGRATVALHKELGQELGQEVADFLAKRHLHQVKRDVMWVWFPSFAKKLGRLSLLKACKALFDLDTNAWDGSNVGGSSWARITQTLIDYEEGIISKILFVDTAFALKHNNALHLNKVWSIHHLQNVLDLNFNGNYQHLSRYASNEVKEYYEQVLQPS